MELQRGMPALEAAGVRVYALSYDEPEALGDFRDAYDITYTLLSDPDSEVIRHFGILNTLIEENDHPWFGIPFPGTYVIDTDGRVTHKFFENNLALRAGPEQILRAARGEDQEPAVSGDPAANPGEVSVDVVLDGDRMTVGVVRELIARFILPRGRHLYASPAPQGMVAAQLELDVDPRVVARPLVRPASTTHSLAGTGETFEVYTGGDAGLVELHMPLTVNGQLTVGGNGPEPITLTGRVRWQSCDDAVCEVPRTVAFEITVPVSGSVIPELIAPADGVRVRAMNGARHFQKMTTRRTAGREIRS